MQIEINNECKKEKRTKSSGHGGKKRFVVQQGVLLRQSKQDNREYNKEVNG